MSPDLVCMMTQCGQETLACLTDRDCLKTLACLVPCGDDQTCTFHCTLNYENEIFHEMTALVETLFLNDALHVLLLLLVAATMAAATAMPVTCKFEKLHSSFNQRNNYKLKAD